MNGGTLEEAQAAKAKLAAVLKRRPELQGIGIAPLDCGYGVKLNLSRRPEDLPIPKEVDGVPVIVAIIEEILPL